MATVYKGWNQATMACRAPMRGVLETRGSWLSSREGGALTRRLEPVTMTLQIYQGFPLFIPEDLQVKTQLWWGMSWDWEFSVSWCVGRWAISPHVHGSQPLYVLSLHSCSHIASRSNLFLSLLVFMFSCHSQLILELSSSMQSNKRRSFNELPLVFIFLSGETHVHLWKRSPIPVSKLVKDMCLLNRTFHIDEQSSGRQGLYTAEWVHQPSNVIGHPFHHLAWL